MCLSKTTSTFISILDGGIRPPSSTTLTSPSLAASTPTSSTQPGEFQVITAGSSPSNDYLRMMGKIYPTRDLPAAHMLVDFPATIAAPFQVLATDYHSYSCVYSCIAYDNYKAEFGFVYSRTPQTSGPATDKCAAVFSANGVNVSAFRPVSHGTDCIYRA
nr:crustacyanin-A2 subunit-like [Penaeus vannamei]